MMESFQYTRPNYYSKKQGAHYNLLQWQHSYPLGHFNDVFVGSLSNMRKYFIKTNINLYL